MRRKEREKKTRQGGRCDPKREKERRERKTFTSPRVEKNSGWRPSRFIGRLMEGWSGVNRLIVVVVFRSFCELTLCYSGLFF